MHLIHALTEEIGDPDLFVGREREMEFLLDWAAGVKRRISKSMGILSRRKKGKTALLQRFYNILYTRNDPQLIPFYYRVYEDRVPKVAFAEEFYRSLLTQYFAFTRRTPEWTNRILPLARLKDLAASDEHVALDIEGMEDILNRFPAQAWTHARKAGHRIAGSRDVRIVQILDEFQYLNRWIVSDDGERAELCYSYMDAAESKVSPQIVAGSYIGWLGAILLRMTGRYRERRLGGLTAEDALAAVYNYAATYQVPITDETASYLAEVCDNDPFYIAATISNRPDEKDLTTKEGVLDALALETVMGRGEIAQVWRDYLLAAFAKVNDVHARKIVLYLAAHDPEERNRDQIREDLKLDMTDVELEKRLHQLVMADILADGSSNFHYKGLGDRIFAMVFRRIYGSEIQKVSQKEIEDDFKRQLDSARRQVAQQRGQLAEHRVRYRLLVASLAGASLDDVVVGDVPPDLTLDRFTTIRKGRLHLDLETSVEIDLHAVSERDDGTDLIVEVKDWERPLTRDAAAAFVETREKLTPLLTRKTAFLLYSEGGVSPEASALLAKAGILVFDVDKLAGYEMPSPGWTREPL
ncbi:MAG: hypothetical protein GY856_09135 [bacterium]|nr:hypothetical protein [bacterium]